MTSQEHRIPLVKRFIYCASSLLIVTLSFSPLARADDIVQGDETVSTQDVVEKTPSDSSGDAPENVPASVTEESLPQGETAPQAEQSATQEASSEPKADDVIADGNNVADETSLLGKNTKDPGGSTTSLLLLPESTAIEDTSTSSLSSDLNEKTEVNTTLDSSATTGDALVDTNIVAGNALTGDATVIATIFNLLQSSWSLGILGDAFDTFSLSIFGDVFGDLFLDPGQQGSPQSNNTPDDITINHNANAAINNTIKLEAVSGDATVTHNISAGSATSGSANVIANIVNAINSSIMTGHSFVGMLNIYGNLNGDVLLPDNLIETLLASNAIGNLDTSNISNAEIIGNFNNESAITNSIHASATTGDATVDTNTTAGNATTGNASTNVTVLNLTGRQVIGKNALLVFVNVLGTWIGVIVDAPQGATSAALGSGISDDTTVDVTSSGQQTITNTIEAGARSGNARVSENIQAGDARSGNAHTAINLLNLNSSQFALSDWFGILFINVFGSWTGSFGIDTAAGGKTLGDTVSSSPVPQSAIASEIKAFKFVPGANGKYTLETSNDGIAALTAAQVLNTTASASPASASKAPGKPDKKTDWLMTIIGISVAASLLGTERILKQRQQQA